MVDWDAIRDQFDMIIEEAEDMDTSLSEIGASLRPETRSRVEARECAMYEFIVGFKREHDGNSPTIREIGDALGMHSTSHIRWYLEKLEKRGLIRIEGYASRCIEVMGGRWVLAGGGYEKNG